MRERQMTRILGRSRRLVLERRDSVAAVAVDHEAGRIFSAEQFRCPTLEKGPGWLLEIIAGMVDQGGASEAALRREIEGEPGLRAERAEHVSTSYVSPGGASERIWLYLAEVSESGRVCAGGALRGEHGIGVVSMSFEETRAALAEGRFADAKTIIGLQWLFASKRR